MARLVYSSGPDGAGKRQQGHDASATRLEPAEHAIRVRPERTGRRGKTVTVCGPFIIERAAASELGKQLRRRCGSGGTLKPLDAGGFAIEIQGDHVETAVELLNGLGFPTRRGGG